MYVLVLDFLCELDVVLVAGIELIILLAVELTITRML